MAGTPPARRLRGYRHSLRLDLVPVRLFGRAGRADGRRDRAQPDRAAGRDPGRPRGHRAGERRPWPGRRRQGVFVGIAIVFASSWFLFVYSGVLVVLTAAAIARNQIELLAETRVAREVIALVNAAHGRDAAGKASSWVSP